MEKVKAVLFDFDGVIADTESQYTLLFERLEKIYPASVSDIDLKARGMTLQDILEKFYGHYPEADIREISRLVVEYEANMDYLFVPGAEAFIHYLRGGGYQVALVTSSPPAKMEVALRKMRLEGLFDTEVTAQRIERGKPDPQCYRLAAADLGLPTSECLVFEDSLAGITSGKSAGARVVGLTTSFPEAQIRRLTDEIIPDFTDHSRLRQLLGEV